MNDGGHIAISPHSSSIIFCAGNVYEAGYFLGVSRSTDAGATWQHDTIPLGSNGCVVAFDPVDSNRVYVGGDSGYSYPGYPALLISTDLGETWTPSHTGLSGKVWALAIDPAGGALLYAGTNSGVFISTDAGATWAVTGLATPTRALALDPGRPGTVYAGTYGSGVHVTTDGGVNWTPMNDGLTCTKVLALALRPGADPVLFAGTEGGAVFRTDIITGVAGPTASGVPRRALVVAPNPAVRGGLVMLAGLRGGAIPVRLYDRAGKLVAVEETTPSGGLTLPAELGAGVYFVRAADAAAKLVVR